MGFKEAGNQETGLSEVFSSWKADQRISSSSRVAAKSSKGDPTEATVKAFQTSKSFPVSDGCQEAISEAAG